MTKLEKTITVLKEKNLSIALAESCSGGYASYLLTKIPGSSKIFKGSIVVYSLEIKSKLFGIPESELKKTQGVSKETAVVLAKKVRHKFKSSLGASIVGFAGPNAKKGVKVGTIYISLCDGHSIINKKYLLKGPRNIIQKKSGNKLIDLIYEKIKPY